MYVVSKAITYMIPATVKVEIVVPTKAYKSEKAHIYS